MRVARLKKSQEALKIHDEKNLDFSLKFDQISSQKSEPNQICYKKLLKMRHPGHFVGPWVDFGSILGP